MNAKRFAKMTTLLVVIVLLFAFAKVERVSAEEGGGVKTFYLSSNPDYRFNELLVLKRLGQGNTCWEIPTGGVSTGFNETAGSLAKSAGFKEVSGTPAFGACDVASWICHTARQGGLICSADDHEHTKKFADIPNVPAADEVIIWNDTNDSADKDMWLSTVSLAPQSVCWSIDESANRVTMWTEGGGNTPLLSGGGLIGFVTEAFETRSVITIPSLTIPVIRFDVPSGMYGESVSEVTSDGVGFPLEGTSGQYIRGTQAAGGKGFHCGINSTICGWDYWRPDKTGARVLASIDGEVVRCDSTGDMALAIRGNGFEVGYLHMDRIDITCGDKVKRGQVIGVTGNRGHSDWNHLHFWIQNLTTGQYDSGQAWEKKALRVDLPAVPDYWAPIDWRARVKDLSPSMQVYGSAETTYPGGIVIHHTVGGAKNENGAAAAVRTHYGESRAPYNLIVGGGNVYQTMDFGRRAFHAGCANAAVVSQCNNLNYFAISVVGDFRYDKLTHQEREALVKAIRWALDQGVPAKIQGHRDVGNTVCPGPNLYPLLAGLLAEAQGRPAGSPDTVGGKIAIGLARLPELEIYRMIWVVPALGILLLMEYMRIRWRYEESLRLTWEGGYEIVKVVDKTSFVELLVAILGMVILFSNDYRTVGFTLLALSILLILRGRTGWRWVEPGLILTTWTLCVLMSRLVGDPDVTFLLLSVIPLSLALATVQGHRRLRKLRKTLRKDGEIRVLARMKLLRMPAKVFWPLLVGLEGLSFYLGYAFAIIPLQWVGKVLLVILISLPVEAAVRKMLLRKGWGVWPWFDLSRLVSAATSWWAVLWLGLIIAAMGQTGYKVDVSIKLPEWVWERPTYWNASSGVWTVPQEMQDIPNRFKSVISSYKADVIQMAREEDLPPAVYFDLWLKEAGGRQVNPDNCEGLFGFHDQMLSGVCYTPGSVVRAQVIEQLRLAGREFKRRSLVATRARGLPDITFNTTDPEVLGWSYVAYNGNILCGGGKATDWSDHPYVMNGYDSAHKGMMARTSAANPNNCVSLQIIGAWPAHIRITHLLSH